MLHVFFPGGILGFLMIVSHIMVLFLTRTCSFAGLLHGRLMCTGNILRNALERMFTDSQKAQTQLQKHKKHSGGARRGRNWKEREIELTMFLPCFNRCQQVTLESRRFDSIWHVLRLWRHRHTYFWPSRLWALLRPFPCTPKIEPEASPDGGNGVHTPPAENLEDTRAKLHKRPFERGIKKRILHHETVSPARTKLCQPV